MSSLEIAVVLLGKGMCLVVLLMLVLYVVQRIVNHGKDE